MVKRRILALFVSVACIASLAPVPALAELGAEAQLAAAKLEFRINAQGDAVPWSAFATKDEAEAAKDGVESASAAAVPITKLDLRLTGIDGTVEYVTKPAGGTWADPEAWVSSHVEQSDDSASTTEAAQDASALPDAPAQDGVPSATKQDTDVQDDGVDAAAAEDKNSPAVATLAGEGEDDVRDAATGDKLAPFSAIKIRLRGTVAESLSVVYRVHTKDAGWQPWVKDGEEAAAPVADGADGTEPAVVDDLQVVLVKTADLKDEADATEQVPEATEPVMAEEPAEEQNAAVVQDSPATASVQALPALPSVLYNAHVQNKGWMKTVQNGAVAGTSGQALRVEALHISLSNGADGGITYRTHVQNKGWMGWVSNGALAGTTGQALRMEALQINLTGAARNNFDVWYRAHVQNIGWQGWVKNGALAGTTGRALRMEAVQIMLVHKGAPTPTTAQGVTGKDGTTASSVAYRTSSAGAGWQGWMQDGAAPGSTARPYVAYVPPKTGYQNPAGYYQLSSRNVSITSAARAPWNYVTPSRIAANATRAQCVAAFVQRAREYVGTPYKWNYSCAPGVGVDCIGLVYQCCYACGMNLGGGTGYYDFNPWAHYSSGTSGWHSHDANNFWSYGKTKHIPVSQRQAGDVLYWPGHVAICLGGNSLIEAYNANTGVIYSNLASRPTPTGCMRLFL